MNTTSNGSNSTTNTPLRASNEPHDNTSSDQITESNGDNLPPNWWGKIQIEQGKNRVWDFGSLLLSIGREEKEWQVRLKHHDISPEQEYADVSMWCGESELTKDDNFKRYVFSNADTAITIVPVLPDRNLVVRPIHTVTLMPSQRVTFYVSASLWLRIETSDEQQLLQEMAIRELSDTWFGPSPRMGELCYASKTKAVVNQTTLTRRPHRAIIPIRIKNQNIEPLIIERINLPIPHLNLYCDLNGQFWSNPISLTKEKGKNNIKMHIHDKAPEYNKSTLISKARKPADSGLILKAYDMLFS